MTKSPYDNIDEGLLAAALNSAAGGAQPGLSNSEPVSGYCLTLEQVPYLKISHVYLESTFGYSQPECSSVDLASQLAIMNWLALGPYIILVGLWIWNLFKNRRSYGFMAVTKLLSAVLAMRILGQFAAIASSNILMNASTRQLMDKYAFLLKCLAFVQTLDETVFMSSLILITTGWAIISARVPRNNRTNMVLFVISLFLFNYFESLDYSRYSYDGGTEQYVYRENSPKFGIMFFVMIALINQSYADQTVKKMVFKWRSVLESWHLDVRSMTGDSTSLDEPFKLIVETTARLSNIMVAYFCLMAVFIFSRGDIDYRWQFIWSQLQILSFLAALLHTCRLRVPIIHKLVATSSALAGNRRTDPVTVLQRRIDRIRQYQTIISPLIRSNGDSRSDL